MGYVYLKMQHVKKNDNSRSLTRMCNVVIVNSVSYGNHLNRILQTLFQLMQNLRKTIWEDSNFWK